MTELLNLPDLPGGMTASARTVVAVPGTAGGPSVAYKAPLGSGGSAIVTSVAGRIGDVVLAVADVAGAYASANPAGYITTAALSTYAPLVSPALTGVPTAPTAAAGGNAQQLATAGFVVAALAVAMPATAGLLAAAGAAGNTQAATAAQLTAAMAAWFLTLPTTLPGTAGQPWNNGRTLAFS